MSRGWPSIERMTLIIEIGVEANLDGGLTAKQLAAMSGRNRGAVERILRLLRDEGLVESRWVRAGEPLEWSITRRRKKPSYRMPNAAKDTWREEAACVGQPQWFIAPSEFRQAHRAAQVCLTCPVIAECAEEQATLEAPGVWAGVWYRPNKSQGMRAVPLLGVA